MLSVQGSRLKDHGPATVSPSKNSRRLDSIQVLRAIAAIAVVLAHLTASFAAVFKAKEAVTDFFMGNTGVDLFFVISGFIMVYASESLFGKPGARRTFLRKRIIRIVPLYWLATSYAFWPMLRSVGFHPSLGLLKIAFGSYFFLPFPLPSTGDPILTVGWTLNYEMFFYLIFATAIFLNRLRAIVLSTAILVACVLIGRLFGSHMSAFWLHFTNPLMLEFVMGMWIAAAFRSTALRISPILSSLLILTGIVIIFTSSSVGAQNVYRAETWGGGYALIVAAVVFANTGARSAFWGPAVLIGEASYAIYLTHWFVLMDPPHLLRLVLQPLQHPLPYSVAIVSLAAGVGIAVHFLIEKPVMAILSQWWLSPRSAALPPIPSDRPIQ